MVTTDRFGPEEVQRILGLNAKQLEYWDRLHLVSPRKESGDRFYDFRDLIGLRTVKQLVEEGVPPNDLRRALSALGDKLFIAKAPLPDLSVLPDGKVTLLQRAATTVSR